MKSLLITFLLLLCIEGVLTAQDSTSNTAAAAVIIYKDARIEALIKKQSAINEESTRDARRNIPGYRIQVISTNDRNAAMAAKAKIYQQFPELKAYLLYQAPYFRLRVGNFREKEEANDYKKELSKNFPNGTSVVRDIIEVKPEKLETEN